MILKHADSFRPTKRTVDESVGQWSDVLSIPVKELNKIS